VNRNIEQIIVRVDGKFPKFADLQREITNVLTESEDRAKMIIFVNTRLKVHEVAEKFNHEIRCRSFAIDGSMAQVDRQCALNGFKNSSPPCALIATAVAERGMDIDDVTHVILFQMPKDIDDYVHRIGRTARGNHRGKSIALFSVSQDAPIAKKLVKVLKQGKQEVPSWLEELARGGE
jgi:ATP-dependent RNA helicase DDX3X